LRLTGCTAQSQKSTASAENNASVAIAPGALQFTDITAQSGIKFKHNNGASGLKFIPETMGSGVAFLDFNNDGYQDIFLVNSRHWNEAELREYQNGSWTQNEIEVFRSRPGSTQTGALKKWFPPRRARERVISALYRNDRDGTFTDVTAGSGLDVEMYGMGAAVGDYDNDGKVDLYVTGYGRNYLFRNGGNGKFQEVAEQAGVRDSGWSTSAAWFDYDKDGKLDLYVCHYLQWTPKKDLFHSSDGREKVIAHQRCIPPNRAASIVTLAKDALSMSPHRQGF
jgi:hypothetical protein